MLSVKIQELELYITTLQLNMNTHIHAHTKERREMDRIQIVFVFLMWDFGRFFFCLYLSIFSQMLKCYFISWGKKLHI